MQKLLMLKGLPASGKSTYAKELVAKGGWKRINKDDLRAMMDNSKFSKGNESFVLAARDHLIKEALQTGLNVVVDDTNLAPKHEENFKQMVSRLKTAGLQVEFDSKSFLDVPVEECIRRDLKRPVSVGEKVIRGMVAQFLMPPVTPYEPVEGTPDAIMVDIDGTLAHMDGRSPYDPTLYHTDTVDPVIRDLVRAYNVMGFKIIICSGRDDTYKPETEKWLQDNRVPYDEIHMRPMAYETDEKKKLKDWIVKGRLFDEHIRNRFNVHFVLDDRNQVVDEWRRLGLKCLQVAAGDF